MDGALTAVLMLVFVILLVNFIFLYLRSKKTWRRKSTKRARTEDETIKASYSAISLKLEDEFKEAEEYLERRRKTWALYEEVRRRAAAGEEDSGSDGAPD